MELKDVKVRNNVRAELDWLAEAAAKDRYWMSASVNLRDEVSGEWSFLLYNDGEWREFARIGGVDGD